MGLCNWNSIERALQCLVSSCNCLKQVFYDYQLLAARRKSLCCHLPQLICTVVVVPRKGVLPPCTARLFCLGAWHRHSISMHGKVVLFLCMAGCVVFVHGRSVVCMHA